MQLPKGKTTMMTRPNLTAPLALVATLMSSAALAQNCVKPVAPILPDKSNLDAATVNAVTAQLEAHIAATNVYLACLEHSDGQTRAETERLIQQWQAPAVTDIQVVTD